MQVRAAGEGKDSTGFMITFNCSTGTDGTANCNFNLGAMKSTNTHKNADGTYTGKDMTTVDVRTDAGEDLNRTGTRTHGGDDDVKGTTLHMGRGQHRTDTRNNKELSPHSNHGGIVVPYAPGEQFGGVFNLSTQTLTLP
jgi:hypothetical protein